MDLFLYGVHHNGDLHLGQRDGGTLILNDSKVSPQRRQVYFLVWRGGLFQAGDEQCGQRAGGPFFFRATH